MYYRADGFRGYGRVVSKFKPRTEIIGVTPNEEVMRRMQIYWGVRPLNLLSLRRRKMYAVVRSIW